MGQSKHLFVSLLLITPITAISTENFEDEDKCKLDNSFWTVYGKFLELSDTIFLTNLYKSEEIDDFATKIIKSLNVTVVVNNNFLWNNGSYDNKRRINFRKPFIAKTEPVRKNESFTDIKKVRHLASDPRNASILIGDRESLNLFLENVSSVQNPRNIYVLFFLGTNVEEIYIRKILKRFWTQLNVLNVIAHGPCSGVAEFVYVYDPFYLRKSGAYGVTKKYSLGDILSNHVLIIHSLQNLNGFSLKVSMFDRVPTATKENLKDLANLTVDRSLGFIGLDASFVSALAKKINCSVTVFSPNDRRDFGVVLQNGSVTGTLGDVVYGRAEISGNSRFLIDYGTDKIEFTRIVHTEQISPVVPKAQQIPAGLAIVRSFNLWSWLAILGVLVISLAFRYFFHFITNNSCVLAKSNIFLGIYGILLGVSVKLRHLQNHYLFNFFLSCCMIFNVIVVGILQGTLVKSYSIISYFKDIDTVEELVESNLPLVTTLIVVDNDMSDLIRRLFLKKKIMINNGTLHYLSRHKNISTLERRRDMDFYIKYYYTGDNNLPFLHIVKECLMTYSVAYILPRGSPYLNAVNNVLSRLVEGGFTEKWYREYVDFVVMQRMFQINYFDLHNPLNFSDLEVAFWCLAFGHLLACVFFIYEIIFKP